LQPQQYRQLEQQQLQQQQQLRTDPVNDYLLGARYPTNSQPQLPEDQYVRYLQMQQQQQQLQLEEERLSQLVAAAIARNNQQQHQRRIEERNQALLWRLQELQRGQAEAAPLASFSSSSLEGFPTAASLPPAPSAFAASEATALTESYGPGGIMAPWSNTSAELLGTLAINAASTDPNAPDSANANKARKMRKKPKDQPKRPLSAYNIFFKEERQRILDEIPEQSADAADEGKPPVKRRKRKRNPHGKIGFESLAKVIGQRWQGLTSDKLAYYKHQSEADKERYRKEMAEYTARQLKGDATEKDKAQEEGDDKIDDESDEAASTETNETDKLESKPPAKPAP
jgi:HMG (high mobility group) box